MCACLFPQQIHSYNCCFHMNKFALHVLHRLRCCSTLPVLDPQKLHNQLVGTLGLMRNVLTISKFLPSLWFCKILFTPFLHPLLTIKHLCICHICLCRRGRSSMSRRRSRSQWRTRGSRRRTRSRSSN